MNREIYNPFSVGVIIIWIIMIQKIKTPYLPIFILISFSYTIYHLYRTSASILLLVISISIMIGFLGVIRFDLQDKTKFIPIREDKITTAKLKIIKDSIPVTGGFLSSGILYEVNNSQLDLSAKYDILIFSSDSLFTGQIVENSKIKWTDGRGSVNLKKVNPLYKDAYFEIRSKIISLFIKRTKSHLLVALLSGNKSNLSVEEINLFRTTGCSHILALSGFHVGIIAMIFLLFSRIIFTGYKIYVVTFVFLFIYLLIVGISPSLLRSVLMFLIGTIFRIKFVKISIYKILIISFYLIIILMPSEFYTLSFQLSYLALFGILTIGEEFTYSPGFRYIPKIIKTPLTASLSAMISTSFIIFPLFGLLYPVGILVSIILTPIITLFIALGIISLIFPNIDYLIIYFERIIYVILNFFSKFKVIDNSGMNSGIVLLTMTLIPVILVILKICRRRDVGRFNLKFKL